MKFLRMISLGVFFLSLFLGSVRADQQSDYWQKLKQKADQIYDGWSVDISVNAGSHIVELKNEPELYGNVELKIPLFSRDERTKRAGEKRKFLADGAKLIRIVEEGEEKLVWLKEKAKLLKTMMKIEGAAGIEAYQGALGEIITTIATIREAQRNMEAMLR